MLNIELDAQTENRLNKLLNIYDSNYAKLINSMFDYRINELRKGLRTIELDFQFYENKFNMKTADFYDNYEKGIFEEQSHINEFMIWSSEYETYLNFQNELKQLL